MPAMPLEAQAPSSSMVGVDGRVVVYVLRGSQYCAKVLAALDFHNVTHTVVFVSALPGKRGKQMPSRQTGALVPEATISGEVIQDSDVILRRVDEVLLQKPSLFPNQESIDLNERVSNGVLAGAVIYYNWVHWQTHEKTIRNVFDRALPAALCCLRGLIITAATKDARVRYRVKAAKQLAVSNDALDDEPAVRRVLDAELRYLSSTLSDGDNKYLLGASEPAAADFTAYAMIERLCGDVGDAKFPCALPGLLDDDNQFAALRAWHLQMRAKAPIKFNGKRLVERK